MSGHCNLCGGGWFISSPNYGNGGELAHHCSRTGRRETKAFGRPEYRPAPAPDDEELLALAHEAFPEIRPLGVKTLYHLIRIAKHAEHHPRFRKALRAALRVFAAREP